MKIREVKSCKLVGVIEWNRNNGRGGERGPDGRTCDGASQRSLDPFQPPCTTRQDELLGNREGVVASSSKERERFINPVQLRNWSLWPPLVWFRLLC